MGDLRNYKRSSLTDGEVPRSARNTQDDVLTTGEIFRIQYAFVRVVDPNVGDGSASILPQFIIALNL